MTGEPEGVELITLPKWGLSMTSATITGWLVAEGARVAPGDPVAEIDTDKINGELESPFGGVVRRIVAPAGAQVPVGAAIAVVADAAVPDAAVDEAAERARQRLASGEASADDGPVTGSVVVDGRTICHATLGEGDEVVVLIHGFGGDKDSWLFVQEPLARTRTVHVLDLPGHGASSKDVGDGSLATLARAVTGFLDELAVTRAHLVGHSLGGAVAAAVANARPGLAASLSLIAPAGFGTEIDASYLRGFTEARTRRELRPHLEKLFADPAQVDRRLVDDVLKYKRLDGVGAALTTLLGTLLDGDRQALDVAALLTPDVPATVVWGTADRIVPPPGAGVVPAHADVHLAEGAGHMVHLEAPGAVIRAIEGRLRI